MYLISTVKTDGDKRVAVTPEFDKKKSSFSSFSDMPLNKCVYIMYIAEGIYSIRRAPAFESVSDTRLFVFRECLHDALVRYEGANQCVTRLYPTRFRSHRLQSSSLLFFVVCVCVCCSFFPSSCLLSPSPSFIFFYFVFKTTFLLFSFFFFFDSCWCLGEEPQEMVMMMLMKT